ncbi:VOC family protein [Pedobacter sp. ASV12]|uniref:VOC family protein n=1 Tax=Pedobacter sp. ASV12 TaxID=2795120 RepID=UPI0018ED3669|nr:VOC family protein [Pedobacter sp. ASV12]
MTKEIWLNLPVNNIKRSVAFFTQIGFTLNQNQPVTENMASLLVGDKKFVIMLFTKELFEGFCNDRTADPKNGTEVLFSIDAESRDEVDSLLQKAEDAGGSIYAKGGEKDGWMYGGGFIDPDGHRWSVLYMDFSKLPR